MKGREGERQCRGNKEAPRCCQVPDNRLTIDKINQHATRFPSIYSIDISDGKHHINLLLANIERIFRIIHARVSLTHCYYSRADTLTGWRKKAHTHSGRREMEPNTTKHTIRWNERNETLIKLHLDKINRQMRVAWYICDLDKIDCFSSMANFTENSIGCQQQQPTKNGVNNFIPKLKMKIAEEKLSKIITLVAKRRLSLHKFSTWDDFSFGMFSRSVHSNESRWFWNARLR